MLVSVVMPVFNGENYVKDMLDSLMRQTYISFRQIRMMRGFRIRFRCSKYKNTSASIHAKTGNRASF